MVTNIAVTSKVQIGKEHRRFKNTKDFSDFWISYNALTLMPSSGLSTESKYLLNHQYAFNIIVWSEDRREPTWREKKLALTGGWGLAGGGVSDWRHWRTRLLSALGPAPALVKGRWPGPTVLSSPLI